MMNYLSKHSVVEVTFAECWIDDTKILTAIGISYENEEHMDITEFGIDMQIAEVLYLQSYTGGGASFPSLNKVYTITMQEYANEVAKYMQGIKEQYIILIDTKGMHTLAILKVLAQVAKRAGKHVSVIAIEPFNFIGRNIERMFRNELERIKEVSDTQTFYSGMEMLEKLDKQVKLPDAEREIVKSIFTDLYKNICLKVQ